MRISFIGLGQMGKGMSLNLRKSGEDLTVYDVNDGMFSEFEKVGVKTTSNISDTWESDIIFLCLPDTSVVESVILGENGLIHHMGPGKLIVDFSTIAYLPTLQIGKKLEEKGIDFIDAPISGRQSKANDGTLTIMCGGKFELFEKIKPLLELMGTDIYYMGKQGNGQLTKMINNCIYNINIAAFCELMTVAVKLGLEPEQIGRVINSGTAQSGASKFFIPQILEGDFSYGFTTENGYKDIVSCVEITSKECLPVPMLDAMNSVYKTCILKGYGKDYKGALVRVYEDLINVKCRKPGFEDR